MLTLIKAIHAELKGVYGSGNMFRELLSRGFSASKARVERMMHYNNVQAHHKRRYKATTDSKHNLPVAQNLLDRDFAPSAPKVDQIQREPKVQITILFEHARP